MTTFAGSPGKGGYSDGKGRVAKFNMPRGMCYDNTTKRLIVCDFNNNRLRRIQQNGMKPKPSSPSCLESDLNDEIQAMYPRYVQSTNL